MSIFVAYTVNPKLSFWGDLPRYPVKNKTVLKHSIFWELAPLSAEDNPVSGFGTCLHLVTLYHRIFWNKRDLGLRTVK